MPEVVNLEYDRNNSSGVDSALLRFWRAIFFTLVATFFVCVSAQSESSDTSVFVSQASNRALACPIKPALQTLLDLHNESRANGIKCSNGGKTTAPNLQWNCFLAFSARTHAMDMFEENFISHKGSGGSTMGTRATEANYEWRSIGENIAEGFDSADGVFQAWLASAAHCKNIANRDYKDIGAAEISGKWVVVFGRHKNE